MALGTTKVSNPVTYTNGGASFPSSIASGWIDAIDTGGVVTIDNAAITDPTSQITAGDRKLIQRGQKCGTLLQFRLVYDSDSSAFTTAPVFAVFGRASGFGDQWQRLRNKSNGLTLTFAAAATDIDVGPLKFTNPDNENHTFDCQGCDEFLVGLETAINPAGGLAALSSLQVKIF